MQNKLLTIILLVIAISIAVYVPDQVEGLIRLLQTLESLKVEGSSTAFITKGSGMFYGQF